jgi:hypothetical protein
VESRFQAAGVERSIRTISDFDVGVLLPRAVESSGTNTLASGKYVAAHPRGVS